MESKGLSDLGVRKGYFGLFLNNSVTYWRCDYSIGFDLDIGFIDRTRSNNAIADLHTLQITSTLLCLLSLHLVLPGRDPTTVKIPQLLSNPQLTQS
jgi:hypothetical protein